MNYLEFDEINKASVIDLDTLDRTIKLEDGAGRLSPAAPLEHVTLFRNLMDMAGSKLKSFRPDLSAITIRQANCKRIKWRGPAAECPIENFLVERVVTKIRFYPVREPLNWIGEEDTEGTMAIGISYNERGIQLAFGHNVSVCQNLNVFGQKVVSTYGSDQYKMSFDKTMELYESWLNNFDEIEEMNIVSINSLRHKVIDEPQRLRIFGKLYENAILRNDGATSSNAPLNMTECSKMIKAGLPQINAKGNITAWDLTNWCTSVLKPESSDMVHVLTKNSEMNEFILREISN